MGQRSREDLECLGRGKWRCRNCDAILSEGAALMHHHRRDCRHPQSESPGPIRRRNRDFNRGSVQKFPEGDECKPSQRRARARAAWKPPIDVAARPQALYPPTAQPLGSRNPARFVAGTATLTGDLCRSFREGMSASRPSAARAPARRGSHRSTSRRAPSTLPTHGPAPRQPQPGPMHDRNCNFNRGTAQKFPGGGAHKFSTFFFLR